MIFLKNRLYNFRDNFLRIKNGLTNEIEFFFLSFFFFFNSNLHDYYFFNKINLNSWFSVKLNASFPKFSKVDITIYIGGVIFCESAYNWEEKVCITNFLFLFQFVKLTICYFYFYLLTNNLLFLSHHRFYYFNQWKFLKQLMFVFYKCKPFL